MSDWTVHLEFEEGTSSKFWRARIDGKTLYVNYGKIGTNGQTQVKDLASPEAARKEYDKLIAEKRKKGYADAGAAGAKADDDGDEGGDEVEDEDEAPRKSKKASAPVAAVPPVAAVAPRPTGGGHRMVLAAGSRQAETHLYLDGKTVRMESTETYADPAAAKKAFERLKQTLAGEGYQG